MNSISIRRRLAAVLLLPFLLVLAGCGKLHADFDIQDVDTINVSYDVAFDEQFMAGQYSSADSMCSDMQDEMGVMGEMAPDVDPYEKDGQLGCVVTGVMTSDNFGTGFDLTEEDGEYHLAIEGDEGMSADLGSPMGDFDFRMTFTFPGAIIEASGGEVDGNSVTFTDVNEVTQGVDIRADASSFPWVIVVVAVLILGFLFLVVLAAVVFFVLRARRNKSTPAAVPGAYSAASAQGAPQGQPGQPGQQGQPGQAGQQWGGQASPPPAPQQGQQWGQPQQGAPQDPNAPQWNQPGQGGQPWDYPGQAGQNGQGGQQPPQSPGW